MTIFLCIIAIGVGFGLGCIAMHLARRKEPDGLPCPHPMCRHTLPRTGLWKADPFGRIQHGAWAEENCPVCEGRILFVPFLQQGPSVTHSEDRYIRIQPPSLPEPPKAHFFSERTR